MGILSSSLSLTRYRVFQKIPDDFWAEIPDRLKKHKFKDIDQTADERSFGWTSFDDMLDTNWSLASPHKGHYLAFALRLDTRRIPPAVMKKHLRLALDQARMELESKGQKFVSRDQKKEIRENVQLKLFARILPIPAVFDVIWDTSAGTVYFGSTSPKARELFQDLFTNTFELHLEPRNPYFQAAAKTDPDRKKQLDEMEPAIFI
ncbi:recombination-associated protein RdgC [Desulfonatronovibrio hydrogenovorans]|uniref:recombination-associated protein RdgC n=1 Tax=Desulfonatronovibrio hydrogenovorans TaxID=53245 RepID=UPI00048E7E7D|nr:recombination-associated protein RdgC [Desulfonatronovibrio hydrogenovorans]